MTAALNGFFRVENLEALREVALRQVAEDVEARRLVREPLNVREERLFGGREPQAIGEHLLALVELDARGERVVRRAWRSSQRLSAPLDILVVRDPGAPPSAEERDRLESLRRLASMLGSRLIVEDSDDVVATAVRVAREQGTTYVLLATPPPARGLGRLSEPLPMRLSRLLPEVDVRLVADREGSRENQDVEARRDRDSWARRDDATRGVAGMTTRGVAGMTTRGVAGIATPKLAVKVRVANLRGATDPVLRVMPAFRPLILLACLAALLGGAASAQAATVKAPKLKWARCFATEKAACTQPGTVATGGALKLAVRAGPTAKVLFTDASGRLRAKRAWWRTASRMWIRVPGWAVTGRVLLSERGRRSVGRRVTVERGVGAAAAFEGDGMWIWHSASRSHGGNPDAIAKRAKASGIETVFVKSGDGTSNWSQFSPGFVSALKKRGLKVCAWQYVYGRSPAAEAAVSARAVKNGADCFVIDAEAEYEGSYAAARTYVAKLRAKVGSSYPIGLAAFPYVNYHPSFPYSVFLAPGAAQFNLPQMYWRAIGTTPDRIFARTYEMNLPYGRPVFPLGQLYEGPASADVQRFRALAQSYGARGVSWWSWQHATDSDWQAATGPAPSPAAAVAPAWTVLGRGSSGDLVVRAQQLLNAAGASLDGSGNFGPATETAVKSAQGKAGLPATGRVDEATWRALIAAAPVSG